ncbi:hypothetical protein K493DRAFT_16681 [Basidiobolus meristosporus CBS 931.73]|uniref:Uncharacterized protein n=1 Tax=Basidiobolus meristosporus CBS 931.73 TaxID=1314790 RepID=A0A1Y1YGZ0_9FUNG|nr:hypothetical protein K493DRAFT_16681 [Basidiobolus meristosporus CBS 931.73]|eukprot:ORX96986.1 hypothetical protein K493DRAFT_16681 [Basidiobolus meristosporus CBS 931.73]
MDTLAAEPPTPCPTTTRAELEASLVDFESIKPQEVVSEEEYTLYEDPGEMERQTPPTHSKEPELPKTPGNYGRGGHGRSYSESEKMSRPASRLSSTSRTSSTSRASFRAGETKVAAKKTTPEPSKRRSMPPTNTRTKRDSFGGTSTTAPAVNKASEPIGRNPPRGTPKSPARTPVTPTRSSTATPINTKGTSRPVTPAAKSPTLMRNSLNRTPVNPTTPFASASTSPSVKRGVPTSATLSSSAKSRVVLERKTTSPTATRGASLGLNKLTTELAEMKQKSEKACRLLAEKEHLLQKQEAELKALRAKLSKVNTTSATEDPCEIPLDHGQRQQLEQENVSELESLKTDFTAEMEKLKSEHRIELDQLRTCKTTEMDDLARREAELVASKDLEVHRLSQQNLDLHSELVALRDEQQRHLEALNKQHQSHIQNLVDSHQAEVSILQKSRRECQDNLEETRGELEAARQRFEEELSSLMDLHTQEKTALEAHHEKDLASLRTEHQENLRSLEMELAGLQTKHRDQLRLLENQAKMSFSQVSQELEESKASYMQNLDSLSSSHDTITEKLRSDIHLLKAEHAQQMETLRSECQQSLQSALTANEESILQCKNTVKNLKVLHKGELAALRETHSYEVRKLAQELQALKHRVVESEANPKASQEVESIKAGHMKDLQLLESQHAEFIANLRAEQQVALNALESENRTLLEQRQLQISELETAEHEVMRLKGQLMAANAEYMEETKGLRNYFEQEATMLQLQCEALAQKIQISDGEIASLTVAHEKELRKLDEKHALDIASFERAILHAKMEAFKASHEQDQSIERIATFSAEIQHSQHLFTEEEFHEYVQEVESTFQARISGSVKAALKHLQNQHDQELERIQSSHGLELHNSRSIMKDYISKVAELNQVRQELEALRQASSSLTQPQQTWPISSSENMGLGTELSEESTAVTSPDSHLECSSSIASSETQDADVAVAPSMSDGCVSNQVDSCASSGETCSEEANVEKVSVSSSERGSYEYGGKVTRTLTKEYTDYYTSHQTAVYPEAKQMCFPTHSPDETPRKRPTNPHEREAMVTASMTLDVNDQPRNAHEVDHQENQWIIEELSDDSESTEEPLATQEEVVVARDEDTEVESLFQFELITLL